MKLFHLYYQFDSTVEDRPLISEKRDHYFVYRNKEDHGFDYNNYKAQTSRRRSVDSVFTFEWIVRNNLYYAFRTSNASLKTSKSNADSGTVHEMYEFREGSDTAVIGTCFLNYSNRLKDIDVSLSRELDSLKKMKLYKARFLSNKRVLKKNGYMIDAFESNYYLTEVPVANKSEILSYFDRFIGDESKFKTNSVNTVH